MQVRPPTGDAASRFAERINRIAGGVARHWLAIFNTLVFIFIALPFFAPILMDAGATRAGRLIYTLYSPTCHQLPERSFFLFGPRAVYAAEELEHDHFLPEGLTLLQRQALRWPGSVEAGFKVALCQRDLAIYGAIFLTGLVFAGVRHRWPRRDGRLRKVPVRYYIMLLLPIAVDGLSQLFGLRESIWPLRLLTGSIMGVATVLFAYPYVEEAMQDVAHSAAHSAAHSVAHSATDSVDRSTTNTP
jgi:uncharacterized membrane protein